MEDAKKEIEALGGITVALSAFDFATQKRMLEYLVDRFIHNPPKTLTYDPSKATPSPENRNAND